MVKDLNAICQKLRAWILWEAGHRTAKSLFRRGKIPIRSGERYIEEFRNGGNWQRKEYPKRIKPKQSPQIIKKVISKAKDRRKYNSLRKMGSYARVSPQTAKRILNSKGLKYSKCYKRVYLNEERKRERVRFAQRMLDEDFDWHRVSITDECNIWLNKCRPKTLWTDNALLEEGSDVHGPKIHLWGGITARGALSLEIFEDNLNATNYLKILKRKTNEMNRLFPDGWVFQHDGSGVHRADTVTRYLDTLEEEPITWPGYSPDISPIENIWGWLKNEVSKEMPRDMIRLKACVRRHWGRIDANFLRPYFDTMFNRMQMIIENEGAKIKY